MPVAAPSVMFCSFILTDSLSCGINRTLTLTSPTDICTQLQCEPLGNRLVIPFMFLEQFLWATPTLESFPPQQAQRPVFHEKRFLRVGAPFNLLLFLGVS